MLGKSTVIIPVYGSHDLLHNLLTSISASSIDLDTIIIIWFDGELEDQKLSEFQNYLSAGLKIELHGTEKNQGYVHGVNSAMDLVLTRYAFILNSDIEVFGNWQDNILRAFDAHPKVGSVSTLSNAGSILSTPLRNKNIVELPTLSLRQSYADLVQRVSKERYPIIVTPVGHLLAVDVKVWKKLGGFCSDFSPGYGEEVDLGERIIAIGHINVLADDVWVSHKNNGSFGNSKKIMDIRRNHQALLEKKHPTFGRRSAIEATSNNSTLAATLRNITKHLIHGKDLSEELFFKDEKYLLLHDYIRELYFEDSINFEILISSAAVSTYRKIFFDHDSRVLFLPNVQNLYNPFLSLSDSLYQSKMETFEANYNNSEYIVLESKKDLRTLSGLYELNSIKTIILPDREFEEGKMNKAIVSEEFSKAENNCKLPQIQYYKTCELDCEETICIHVKSRTILMINEIRNTVLSHDANQRTNYNGRRLSWIKKLIIGTKAERCLIPAGSKRRNTAKICLHKVTKLYMLVIKK